MIVELFVSTRVGQAIKIINNLEVFYFSFASKNFDSLKSSQPSQMRTFLPNDEENSIIQLVTVF